MPVMTQPLPCPSLNVTMDVDTDSAGNVPTQSLSSTDTPLQEVPRGGNHPNVSATATDTRTYAPDWVQLDRELLETKGPIVEAGEVLDEPHVHRDFVSRRATLLDAAAILKAAGKSVSGQEMNNLFGCRHRIQDDLKRWIQTANT